MTKATRAITEVLTNIKDMEAVSLGVKKLDVKQININEIISDLIFFFKDKLEYKNIKIRLKNELSNDTLVIAEPKSLSHQVLSNIMSNAIKFSEQNSTIEIHLRLNEKSQIRVTIKDRGIGIPKEQLAKVFSLVSNNSRTGTAGEKGTGFGMPIAKTFVEKYGGHLSVESM